MRRGELEGCVCVYARLSEVLCTVSAQHHHLQFQIGAFLFVDSLTPVILRFPYASPPSAPSLSPLPPSPPSIPLLPPSPPPPSLSSRHILRIIQQGRREENTKQSGRQKRQEASSYFRIEHNHHSPNTIKNTMRSSNMNKQYEDRLFRNQGCSLNPLPPLLPSLEKHLP